MPETIEQPSTSDPPLQNRKQQLTSQSRGVLERLEHEAQEAGSHAWTAFASFAWLWPIRGLLYSINRERNTNTRVDLELGLTNDSVYVFLDPHLILSVRYALFRSLIVSIVVFSVLVFFTFLPQMAVLAIFTGPLAPIFALILVGAEALVLIALFGRALFLGLALTHVFDATLAAQGQTQLLKEGKARAGTSGARDVGSQLMKPFQAFSQEGMLRYALTLPLNFIPGVGTVLFLLYNGHKGGPGWHSRYFELKGLPKAQRVAFVEKRRAEYTACVLSSRVLCVFDVQLTTVPPLQVRDDDAVAELRAPRWVVV